AHGPRDPAVLDQVSLAGREDELAGRDVDLTTAEVLAIKALLDGADDLLRLKAARQHVRVRHAWQGHVRERFAAAVARRPHSHQAGVELVLHVAAQHTVFDQRRALRRGTLVVYVERPTTRAQRAVVNDGALIGSHLLADASRERRRSLAVEIAFEPVTDRFVQQHTRPTRS